MRMPKKCRNNNSDNPLAARHTDGGKKENMRQTEQHLFMTT